TQLTLQMTGTDIKTALSYDPIIVVKVLNQASGNNALCIKLTQGVADMKIRQ
ncbi:MAG: hypothetical protein JWO06_2927, partial [Bacteroidota bacterium]|nr:hypothetical protein [Bacteroidota bacterium]